MPFTISHVAAVIPFARKPFVLSALVVGSMAPDFDKFLFLGVNRFSLSLPGLILFCLPVSLVVLWLFHSFFKQPLASLLPESWQERLPVAKPFAFLPIKRLLLIVNCILLGALTHVVWDSLTHKTGWIAAKIPFLQMTLMHSPFGVLRVYKVLQHASTLLGGLILICAIARWFQRTPRMHARAIVALSVQERLSIVLLMAGIGIAIGAVYGFWKVHHLSGVHQLRFFAGHAVIAAMATFAAELILFSAFWHRAARAKRCSPQM